MIAKIPANPCEGFLSPYYLFIPTSLFNAVVHGPATLLIVPNNTGTASDDLSVHDASALKTARRWVQMATELKAGLLVPVFPRPKSNDLIYTHALGRSAMTTDIPVLKRIDLQLIAMIDDARARERQQGVAFQKRVLMFGFSASGMFTNRFVFIHPDRIEAAAFGSPGGWAIAPVSSWHGTRLPYPVGVADLAEITGTAFRLHAVQQVPQFLYMGTEDQNDSVVFRDSYDEASRKIIFDLFGSSLMGRWPFTVDLYKRYLPKVLQKLYPGVNHQNNVDMVNDAEDFFRKHLSN
jgi:pimeloyl-ACP methyl ester carboxylesterase